MSKKNVFVRKEDGELEQFQPEKLRTSMRRSGATEHSIERVMEQVAGSIHEGMKTRDIYRLAYRILRRESRPVATRYRLRHALMELGPSGYPFERLAGEIFRAMGYEVEVGITVQGQCVRHEVDVLGRMDHTHAMAECKYHNRAGEKSDVKTAMYVSARFDDIRRQYARTPELRDIPVEAWLVTNTKFSADAVSFGLCVGLRLLAWDFPQRNNLQELIERYHLYPVTSLISLTPSQKRQLLQRGIILYSDILAWPDILKQCGVSETKAHEVHREIANMMKSRPASASTLSSVGEKKQ